MRAPRFPCGTLAVNIPGSLVMGLLVGWFAQKPIRARPEDPS